MDPTQQLLQHFAYDQLPPETRRLVKPFHDLALEIVDKVPSNAERTVSLRKLLESMDCVLRAVK